MCEDFNKQQEEVVKEAERLLELATKLGTNDEDYKESRTILCDMLTDILYMLKLVERHERKLIKIDKEFSRGA